MLFFGFLALKPNASSPHTRFWVLSVELKLRLQSGGGRGGGCGSREGGSIHYLSNPNGYTKCPCRWALHLLSLPCCRTLIRTSQMHLLVEVLVQEPSAPPKEAYRRSQKINGRRQKLVYIFWLISWDFTDWALSRVGVRCLFDSSINGTFSCI